MHYVWCIYIPVAYAMFTPYLCSLLLTNEDTSNLDLDTFQISHHASMMAHNVQPAQ